MTDRDKLVLHLQNLLKSNKNTATLDVKFLLGVLDALPKEPPSAVHKNDSIGIDIDGGSFCDSN